MNTGRLTLVNLSQPELPVAQYIVSTPFSSDFKFTRFNAVGPVAARNVSVLSGLKALGSGAKEMSAGSVELHAAPVEALAMETDARTRV